MTEDLTGQGNVAQAHNVDLVPGGPDNWPYNVAYFTGDAQSLSFMEIQSVTLDTKYSLSILIHLYPEEEREGSIVSFCSQGTAVKLTQKGRDVLFYVQKRDLSGIDNVVVAADALQISQWNYVAATYDYSTGRASLYYNGNVTSRDLGQRLLATQGNVWLGGVTHDATKYKGRMSCLQIYSYAKSEEELNMIDKCSLRECLTFQFILCESELFENPLQAHVLATAYKAY